MGPPWTLSTVRINVADPRVAEDARDAKRMHDRVIQAALAGEPARPVLWAQPSPHVLIIRHDRPVARVDFLPGWATAVTHSTPWYPAAGDVVELATVQERGMSGQSHAQYARDSAAKLAKGSTPRGARKPHRVRDPQRVLEVTTGRLAACIDIATAAAVKTWHQPGRRPRDGGRVMHTNPVLIRVTGTVTDATGLHALMDDGLGRHKSFGCGMILARPATGAPGC